MITLLFAACAMFVILSFLVALALCKASARADRRAAGFYGEPVFSDEPTGDADRTCRSLTGPRAGALRMRAVSEPGNRNANSGPVREPGQECGSR